MSTELQSETSRANGAKSKGPKTAEGRQTSSRNAIKHGFTAVNTILIDCENPDEFTETAAAYDKMYQPGALIEQDLVESMVFDRWRVQRLMIAENSLINRELGRQRSLQTESLSPGDLIADVFTALADNSKAYTLVTRYLSQLNRHHERCLLILRVLQYERMAQVIQPAALQFIQPGSPTPPAPELNPAPQTQPEPSAPMPVTLPPAARQRHKNSRNEPGARPSFRPFRLSLRAFAPRPIPQLAARRRSIA